MTSCQRLLKAYTLLVTVRLKTRYSNKLIPFESGERQEKKYMHRSIFPLGLAQIARHENIRKCFNFSFISEVECKSFQDII